MKAPTKKEQERFYRLLEESANDVEALNRRRLTGYKDTFVRLYPNESHYVYELLQNAEDAKATTVRFKLLDNGVWFEHNGSKLFSVDDIDAIASAANDEGKHEDETAIGKFGVGFKSVFAYTNTPEVHSGCWHFQIYEHVGVREIKPDGPNGPVEDDWTRFWLPFNRDEKPASQAHEETRRCLEALGSDSVLFLRNIRRIEHSVKDGVIGYAQRQGAKNGIVTIACQPRPDAEPEETKWLCYSKEVTKQDEMGCTKRFPVSIAFKYSTEGGKGHIEECDGKAFIFFPAESEKTGLHFHINALFVTTPARDVIKRDAPINAELLADIADLLSDALIDIRDRRLLTVDFLGVLPIGDELFYPEYHALSTKVYEAFNSNELLPLVGGSGYVSVEGALRGSKQFYECLDGNALITLFGLKKNWIANPMRNSHADKFLHSLKIQEMNDYLFVAELLEEGELLKYLKRYVDEKPEFISQFAFLAAGVFSSLSRKSHEISRIFDSRKEQLAKKLAGGLPIPCADDSWRTAKEGLCFPVSAQNSRDSLSFFVKQGFAGLRIDKNKEKNDEVRRLFGEMGIREYNKQVELERQLVLFQDTRPLDDFAAHVETLLKFERARKAGDISIDFSEYALFLPEGKNRKRLVPGCEVVFDSGVLSQCLSKPPISDLYWLYWQSFCKEELDREDVKKFSLFLSLLLYCGVKDSVQIIPSDAHDNPTFESSLNHRVRRSVKVTNIDWTIEGIDYLLSHPSIDSARLILGALREAGNSGQYLKAEYSLMDKERGKYTCDSTFIQLLRESEWLPDKQGVFHKPADIEIGDVAPEITIDEDNILFQALRPKNEEAMNEEKDAVRASAAAHGMVAFDCGGDEKKLQFLLEAEKQYESRKASRQPEEGLSISEALSADNKNQRALRGAEDNEAPSGFVSNPERRARNAEGRIKEKNSSPAKPKRKRIITSEDPGERAEEKENLKMWYDGHCQICKERIRKADGGPYFEAIDFIDAKHLTSTTRKSVSEGWNSLCLCPNCAARWKFSQKNTDGLYDMVRKHEVSAGDEDPISFPVTVEGKPVMLKFNPKHLIVVQKGWDVANEDPKESDS